MHREGGDSVRANVSTSRTSPKRDSSARDALAAGPLLGKRVLVLRAREQAAETARLLRERGAEPVELPAIEIVDPPDPTRVETAMRDLGRYDLVAVTSANGAVRFMRALERDASRLDGVRVAAIGQATAEALAAFDVRPDVIPGDFVGEALASAILFDPPIAERLAHGAPVRVLVARALVARDALPEALRARGVDVDDVPFYATRAVGGGPHDELARRLHEGSIDVVLLTSGSTVDHLCDRVGKSAPDALARTFVASIGPVTTARALERGLRVDVTASTSTLSALISAVEQALLA